MAKDKCQNCSFEFDWDIDLGLNVKYYESEATSTHFRAGGVFPCCPNCDLRVVPIPSYSLSYIKMETKFVSNLPRDYTALIKK